MKDKDNLYVEQLLEFIKGSPSSFHVIDNFKSMLVEAGYKELFEEEEWTINNNGKYFCVRSDSSIIAFVLPENNYKNLQIIAAHSDSPTFKIKENPEVMLDSNYVELNVEKYGGMICSTWFDRPLSVAGRVIINKDNQFKKKLIDIDSDLLMIPSVAIHMNREINEGYKYNAQMDMMPIFGDETSKGQFKKIIAKAAGCDIDAIYGSDLFLYNRVEPSVWGVDGQFFSSSKIDDLECAYTAMTALINSDNENNKESVRMCAVFDNEEVGSQTKQGAASTFLYDVLSRINASVYNGDLQHYQQSIAQSFMISADNAHAVHPHHINKADLTNKPYMNRGIVIKYNANQKYTTDGVSAALFKGICKKAGVPVQAYVNRSDIAGGSTLGNIANSQVSLNTVDIGAAQLAMHSPYETAGVKDVEYMVRAFEEFYNTHIEKDRSYGWRIG